MKKFETLLFSIFTVTLLLVSCSINSDKIVGYWTSHLDGYLSTMKFNSDGTGKITTVIGTSGYYECKFNWKIEGCKVQLEGQYTSDAYDFDSSPKSGMHCTLTYKDNFLQVVGGFIPGIPFAYINPVFTKNPK